MCGQHMLFQSQKCSFQCHTAILFIDYGHNSVLYQNVNLGAFMYGRSHYHSQWKSGQYGLWSLQRDLVNQLLDAYLIELLNFLTALTRFSLNKS